jgi:hypothetical protein
MARITLPVAPLALALAACGGGDSSAQMQADTQPHAAARPARAAVRIFTPARGRVVAARPLAGGRLDALVRVSGRAAPGQQLALNAACARFSCDGITFADSNGRWRTRVELVAPKARRAVRLRVNYADATGDERPAAVTVRLRRAPAPPPAAPQKAPAPSQAGSGGQAAPATGGQLSPYRGPRTMIVIGDSLAVGMAGYLRGDLPGWDVAIDGRTGRPLGEGMQLLSEAPLPTGSRGAHAILAFSLFTNDTPANVDALDAAVRESVSHLGPHGCAIWATIARPPLNGVSYRVVNDRLMALAAEPELYGRLLIVPWKREYGRHPSWQRPDHVHATAEGYAARAQMYADVARGCPA